MITHPIDSEEPFLRRSIDYISSRAHTEGIHPSSILQLLCQLICRSRKVSSLFSPILGRVDHLLQVLHTHSDCERFCLHGDFPEVEHLKSIPGAVTDRKDKGTGPELFLPVYHDGSLLRQDVCHFGMEPELSSQFDDPAAHGLHHTDQDVRPDMRFLLIQDLRRSSESHESFQDKTVPSRRVLHKCI